MSDLGATHLGDLEVGQCPLLLLVLHERDGVGLRQWRVGRDGLSQAGLELLQVQLLHLLLVVLYQLAQARRLRAAADC